MSGDPAFREKVEAGRRANIEARREKPIASVQDLSAIQWPLRFTLPWSTLISDNAKYGVINGSLILTKDYRRAKGLVRAVAKQAVGEDREPANYALRIVATVWVPDDMRAHDVCNFAKCVHDALEGVVYTKDRWLHDISWRRAGVDVDAPRAEITIQPVGA